MMQMQQHYQDKMINAVLNHIKAGMNDRAPDLFLPSYETTLIHAFRQNMKPAACYEDIPVNVSRRTPRKSGRNGS